MILDAELILAEKQTLTSTFTSKALDLGQKNPDGGGYGRRFDHGQSAGLRHRIGFLYDDRFGGC